MTIDHLRIQWGPAFVFSAAVMFAACSSSSNGNDGAQSAGGSGGTSSPDGSTGRVDSGSGGSPANTGGSTVIPGGSGGSSAGVDAWVTGGLDSAAGRGGAMTPIDGSAGGSGGSSVRVDAADTSIGGSLPNGGATTASGGVTGSGGGAGSIGSGGTGGAGTGTTRRRCGETTDTPETPIVVVPSQATQMYSIAADSANIYFNDRDSHSTVRKVPKTGGAPTTLFSTDHTPSDSYGIVVDDTHVYFSFWSSNGGSKIMRVSKDASPSDGGLGTAEVVSDVDSFVGNSNMGSLALDATNVYLSGSSTVIRIPKAGGPAVDLFDPKIGSGPVDPSINTGPTDSSTGMAIGFPGIVYLVVDGTWAYYIAGQTYGGAIANDSPLAYAGWLLKVPLQGGAPAIVAGRSYVPLAQTGLSVTNGFAYWTDGGNAGGNWLVSSKNTLYKQSVDNSVGAPVALWSGSDLQGQAPVSDGKNVYFVVGWDLCKVSVDGGDAVGLLYGNLQLGAGEYPTMVVDETNVYVTAYSNHGILAVPK